MLPRVNLPKVDTGRFVFGASAKAAPDIRANMPALYPRQAEVKAQLARFNVLDLGRRWGKNVFEHDYLVDGLLTGGPCAWGSPTYKNMTDDWRTLREVL